MHTRQDALQAAARVITEIGTLPTQLSADAVATVGEVAVEPNSINVIPGEVTFTIDLRSYNKAIIDEAVELAESELAAACRRHNCSYELEPLQRHEATAFAPRAREVLGEAADAVDVEWTDLVSGAGHDAQHLQAHTKAGMVFVPSVEGKTHVEAEYTEWEDCVAGAAVIAEATRRLASE
jgi:N-carbamoyl-L-amino-acid hydrolase